MARFAKSSPRRHALPRYASLRSRRPRWLDQLKQLPETHFLLLLIALLFAMLLLFFLLAAVTS